MSPLSSSTLFHFTNSSKHLLPILADEFRPHYALEDLRGVLGAVYDPLDIAIAIPMVSFCDIPLSQTLGHMGTYGSYCLGLTKSWGQRLGVAPALYRYPKAATTEAIIELHLQIEQSRGTMDHAAAFSRFTERFLCFLKPYEGHLRRKGSPLGVIRFYDEREWRYVPPGPWFGLPRREFDNQTLLGEANADVAGRYRLSFDPSDIRYIVVATEEEIRPMVNEVRRIKTPKYTAEDIDLLCTRIVSACQIADDF